MKRLFLIRHAKSSWDDAALADQERPLNERGKRDAPKIGERLARREVKPDLILSSPAVRALTTAKIIAGKLDYKRKHIGVDERLYAASADELLEIIHALDDRLQCVMIVGHNPELSELAQRLCGEIDHLPTGAVAEFGFAAKSWADIGACPAATVAFDYPKKTSAD